VDEGRVTRGRTPWLLLAPGLAWLVLFFVIPLVTLGRTSLEGNGLANFSDVFSDNREVIQRTFAYALVATLIALVIAYPLAYFIAIKAERGKGLLLALVVLPFFTTYLIRTLAWKTLLFDNGPIVSILVHLHLLAKNGQILNTHGAVIGALVYNYLPFMVLPIFVSLEKIDRRLLEAAPDLYADGFTTFRRVTLPLSMPGVFAGTLLTFIPSCGDFVNAELLGGDRQRMIGNIIEANFAKEVFRPTMSALSFVLMLIILVGVLAYARILGTEEIV
jgi:spermidine/putrescine transport system permease protein